IVASLAIGSAPSGGSERPVLAGTSEGLFRSDDRGTTWAPIGGLPSSDFNLALFNPANADQIYAGSDADQGNGGVFRSLDRRASTPDRRHPAAAAVRLALVAVILPRPCRIRREDRRTYAP